MCYNLMSVTDSNDELSTFRLSNIWIKSKNLNAILHLHTYPNLHSNVKLNPLHIFFSFFIPKAKSYTSKNQDKDHTLTSLQLDYSVQGHMGKDAWAGPTVTCVYSTDSDVWAIALPFQQLHSSSRSHRRFMGFNLRSVLPAASLEVHKPAVTGLT